MFTSLCSYIIASQTLYSCIENRKKEVIQKYNILHTIERLGQLASLVVIGFYRVGTIIMIHFEACCKYNLKANNVLPAIDSSNPCALNEIRLMIIGSDGDFVPQGIVYPLLWTSEPLKLKFLELEVNMESINSFKEYI